MPETQESTLIAIISSRYKKYKKGFIIIKTGVPYSV